MSDGLGTHGAEEGPLGAERLAVRKALIAVTAVLLSISTNAGSAHASYWSTYKSTASPMTVHPSYIVSSLSYNQTIWSVQMTGCSSGTWTKRITLEANGHMHHAYEGSACISSLGADVWHYNTRSACASKTGGTWYANCRAFLYS